MIEIAIFVFIYNTYEPNLSHEFRKKTFSKGIFKFVSDTTYALGNPWEIQSWQKKPIWFVTRVLVLQKNQEYVMWNAGYPL